MASMRFVALSLALPLISALRLGDDAPPKSATDEAKVLVKYFGDSSKYDPKRQAVAEAQSKDGDGTNMKFEYLNTTCLKQRAQWAAKQFESVGGCSRLLEIGGYLTPFPIASKGAEGKEGKGKESQWDADMELYVNSDPSAKKTQEEDFSDKYATVTLQLVLKELTDALKDDKALKKMTTRLPFDCFLMLGVWNTQVGSTEKQAALAEAVKHSKIAILESPQSDPDGRKFSEPIMKKAGFKISSEHLVDCSKDEEALEKNKNDPQYKESSLKRDMVVYIKESGKSKAKEDKQ